MNEPIRIRPPGCRCDGSGVLGDRVTPCLCADECTADALDRVTAERDRLESENAELRTVVAKVKGERDCYRAALSRILGEVAAFNATAEEVRAILEGRKTQTRRVVKHERHPAAGRDWQPCLCREIDPVDSPCLVCEARFGHCPHGAPGDRLWVRETWAPYPDPHAPPNERPLVAYRATQEAECQNVRWRPSIHMPRWASRITLELTSVRVERLKDIGEEDARAEGVEWMDPPGGLNVTGWRGHRFSFSYLWDSLNAKRAPWASNPWCWVLEFKRVTT
jgi:hypothetical protein